MISSRVVVFKEANRTMETETIIVPDLKVGEILVKNEYVTLCKSDINTFFGKRSERTPSILGHEIVGRVHSLSEHEPITDARGITVKIGDRITWAIFASDPESDMSKRGIPQKASDLFKYGHEEITQTSHLHGGLADYIILRANTPVIKINESVPVPVAALINCSIATISGALRIAGDMKNKRVLIAGTGMLGIVACAMAKTHGASSVFATDVNQKRIDTAMLFGADQRGLFSDDLASNLKNIYGSKAPFDIVIELSGQPDTMEYTLGLLATGGTAVWVGATYPARNTSISAEKLIRKIHTIKGLHNYNLEDFVNAVSFIEENHEKYPFLSLIYDGFNLAETNKAFSYASDKNPFRVGIKIS